MSPHDTPARPDLRDAVERVAPAVVGIVTRRHRGAGLIWRDGVVVTSAGALWRERAVSIVPAQGEPLAATVRGLDAGTDLAALAIATGVGAVATESAGASPRVGDEACAVGRRSSGTLQATFGRIGAVNGDWRTWRGGRIDRFVELDGHLRPGFDGAAIANAHGHVLGIASHAFTRHTAVVVPSSTVERVLDELLAHGRVRRGYLGIAAQPVRATLDGVAVAGLLVSSIADDGPAARAGLQVGDIVVRAGDTPTPTLEALRDALGGGASVRLVVARGGQRVELEVSVGERPTRHGCG